MSAAERPIMILAGGTGGHVYPALAVARCLLARDVPVVWMGTRQGLEARVVPAAGIPIAWLSIGGLRGKGVLAWLLAPVRLNLALAQAFQILLRYRPRAVLGMGGFAAGPGGVMAFILSRPLVIHEQNAIAGLTNRWLASLASKLVEGFPGAFRGREAVHTGNPVRAEIAALPAPAERFAERAGALRLLVLGGSLGARMLNEIVPQALKGIGVERRPEVWHQAGRSQIQSAHRAYRQAAVDARIEPFIEDMASAYAWADLVVCRAGALTVAEVAAAGVAAVLVPYPHAVDDHQSANARFLTDAGAAIMVRNEQLNATRLIALLERFIADRARLRAMASAARELAIPDADERVANVCVDAAAGRGRA